MSKILLINGSPHETGCTYTALSEVAASLHACGVDTELLWLGTQPVAGCIACGKCYDTGRCVFDDKVNDLLAHAQEFDGMVVGSPVYYAGPAGQLCAFLDRLFYASRGCWSRKVGAAVVSCRRGGATAAFDRLNKYFTISNMPVAPSQYWNMVHGNHPEEVLQDKEGLQIMRTLGKNIAWMVDGTKQVCQPQYEPRVSTNFIR